MNKQKENNNFNLSVRDDYTAQFDFKIDIKPDPNNPNETEEGAKKIAEDLLKEMATSISNQPIDILKEPKEDKNMIQSKYIFDNILDLFDDFIIHKEEYDKIGSSSIKGYRTALRYLLYFMEENSIYNFQFFKNFQQQMKQLPKHMFTGNQYIDMSFEDILKLKKQTDYETLNPKTINNVLHTCKMFFDFLIYEECIENTTNPVEKIKPLPEEAGTNKEEYTHEEITLILNSDKIEQIYKDFIKVDLYTGFRLQELVTLKKENIDLKNKLINVTLKDTSTKKHTKTTPIHPNILPIIERQLKQGEDDFLFWNATHNAIGKRINTRIKKVVPDKNKSFHSFKKNFSQEIELNTNAEEKVKKYLLSHSFKDITHTIYNRGKVNIDKLWDCINQISFEY